MGILWPVAGAAAPPPPAEALYFAGDIGRIACVAVIICAVFTVVHTLIAFLVPAAFPIVRKLPTAARADLMMQIMWLIGCTPLPFMYAFAIPDLIATPELRWQGHSWLVEWALMLHARSALWQQQTG